MGVRGYFEEGYSGDHLLGSYFNHLYELMDIRHDQLFKGFVTQGAAMINAVDWLYTRLWVDGEQLDLAKSAFSDFSRRLDMRTGVLSREFVWQTPTGKHLQARPSSASPTWSRHALGCQRIVLEPLDFSGAVTLRLGLDFNTHYEIGAGWDQTGSGSGPGEIINFWHCNRKSRVDGGVAIQAETTRSGHQLFSGLSIKTEQPVETSIVVDDKFIGADLALNLERGRPTTVDRIVVNDWARTADGRTRSGTVVSSRCGVTPAPRSKRSWPSMLPPGRASGTCWTSKSKATPRSCRACDSPASRRIRPITARTPTSMPCARA